MNIRENLPQRTIIVKCVHKIRLADNLKSDSKAYVRTWLITYFSRWLPWLFAQGAYCGALEFTFMVLLQKLAAMWNRKLFNLYRKRNHLHVQSYHTLSVAQLRASQKTRQSRFIRMCARYEVYTPDNFIEMRLMKVGFICALYCSNS